MRKRDSVTCLGFARLLAHRPTLGIGIGLGDRSSLGDRDRVIYGATKMHIIIREVVSSIYTESKAYAYLLDMLSILIFPPETRMESYFRKP